MRELLSDVEVLEWGTVDLITYQLSLLQQYLNLVEASLGFGSLCGVLFLSRGFEEFLDEKLGNEIGWDDKVLEEAYMGDVSELRSSKVDKKKARSPS